MELKMTFVIETSIPADVIEMNILKKFDEKIDKLNSEPSFTTVCPNCGGVFVVLK